MFLLKSAASVRRLRVDPPDKRPEWVYIVGKLTKTFYEL